MNETRENTVLLYSTGTNAGLYPEDEPYYTNETVSTRGLPMADVQEPERSHTATRRYRPQQTSTTQSRIPRREVHIIKHGPARASRMPVPVQVEAQAPTRIRLPLRTYIIGFLILAVVGWLLINIALSVIHNVSDNLTYGNPRTYQTDEDVGHGGVSHFVAMNLDGHIIVVEIVNHEISTTKTYDIIAISGENASLAPVTLSFESHTTPGVLDMVVNVAGGSYVWPNTGKDFQANKAGNS